MGLPLAICLFLALSAHAAETRYFRGELSDQLSVQPDRWSAWTWHVASPDEIRRLGLRPEEVEHAFAGECKLPDDPKRPVHGRIVQLKDSRWFAYLDVNRDGTFGPEEGAPLEVLPPGSTAAAQARIMLPLKQGAYREMPILVALPSAHYAAPPSAPGTQRVLIGSDPFISGYAQLPFGRVLLHFAYDLMRQQPTLDVARTQQWMDLNLDGAINTVPGSPEVGNTFGAAPVFHVKDFYLETTRIDPETRTFTMKTVPSNAYRRIAMGLGDRLPDFEFRNFSDKKRRLSDVKGKYRLLNFWATSCGPCVEQIPGLKAAYDRYHSHGFEILGMNGDEATERPENMMDQFDIHWPQAKLDAEMIQKRFQISTWPTNVLIDRHGRVVALLNSDGELDATLQRLLE